MFPDPYLNLNLSIYNHKCYLLDRTLKTHFDLVSQGFHYCIIFTNQFLIYSKFISNIINIIERKIHKFNSLHLKCFPGFTQQLENLVFVEFLRFWFSFFFLFQKFLLYVTVCSKAIQIRLFKCIVLKSNNFLL